MSQTLAMSYTNRGGATTCQVYTNNNGVFTPLGTAWTPSGGLFVDGARAAKKNLVIEFGGFLYARCKDAIAVYNPSTGAWDADYSPHTVNSESWSGIYLGKNSSGNPRLITVHRRTTGALTAHYLDTPGGSWATLALAGGSFTSNVGFNQCIVYRNSFHFNGGGYLAQTDIGTLSNVIQNINGGGSQTATTYCRAGGRLFLVRPLASSGGNLYVDLYELVGGSWTIVLDGSTSTPTLIQRSSSSSPQNQTESYTLWFDEPSNSLILMGYQDRAGDSGQLVLQINIDTYAVTDITSTVNPPFAFPSPTLSPIDLRYSVEVDDEADPLNPVTYIWHGQEDGIWARFQWNGVSSAMTALGTGGSRSIGIVHNPTGGGQYNYSPSTTLNPAYDIQEVQSRVALVGGTRLFFTGFQFDQTGGSPTPTDETVGIYYGTTEATADNLATISNPQRVSGTGTIPSLLGGKITGFTCDNTTVYSVDWDAVGSDGLVSGDYHMLRAHIEI